eukprot:TRINITY_DN4165_c0_g1_i7.p1 TRINITY_DN4165_c0_g1~~TRINITY_DN4165_c0_g1_i7.p1  ORF type:complete len:4191 (+),score=803.60 TRINITY_DN4165_c0_g1_i7:51-12623(+)
MHGSGSRNSKRSAHGSYSLASGPSGAYVSEDSGNRVFDTQSHNTESHNTQSHNTQSIDAHSLSLLDSSFLTPSNTLATPTTPTMNVRPMSGGVMGIRPSSPNSLLQRNDRSFAQDLRSKIHGSRVLRMQSSVVVDHDHSNREEIALKARLFATTPSLMKSTSMGSTNEQLSTVVSLNTSQGLNKPQALESSSISPSELSDRFVPDAPANARSQSAMSNYSDSQVPLRPSQHVPLRDRPASASMLPIKKPRSLTPIQKSGVVIVNMAEPDPSISAKFREGKPKVAKHASFGGTKANSENPTKNMVQPPVVVNTADKDTNMPDYCPPHIVDPQDFLSWLQGRGLSFKFVYAIYRMGPNDEAESIYRLRIIPYPEVDWKNYFLLTPLGIVHYKHDRHELEMIHWEDWIDQKMIFDTVMQKPFFNMYHKRKAFKGWRSFVRRRKRAENSLQIERRLMLLSKPLLNAVILLRKRALQFLHDHTLVATQPQTQKLSVDEFLAQQNHYLMTHGASMLLDFVRFAIQSTLQACQAVVQENGGLIPRDENDLKSELQIRNIRRLRSFIRLMDMHVVSFLIAVTLTSTIELLRCLTGASDLKPDDSEARVAAYISKQLALPPVTELLQSAPPNPRFFVRAIFGPDSYLQFDPPLVEAYDWIDGIVRQYQALVVSLPRVSSDSQLMTYMSNFALTSEKAFVQQARTSLNDVISYDGRYSVAAECVKVYVNDSFERATDHISHMYKFIEYLNCPQEYNMNRLVVSEESSVQEFRKYLLYFTQQSADVKSLHHDVHVGCLSINFGRLVNSLTPICVTSLENLHRMIPKGFEVLLEYISSQIAQRRALITRVPRSLDDCVDWLDQVQKLAHSFKTKEDVLFFRLKDVDNYIELMDEYNIPFKADERTLAEKLQINFDILGASIETTTYKKSEMIANFTPDLRHRREELSQKIESLNQEVLEADIYMSDANPEIAIRTLYYLSSKVTTLDNEITYLSKYEKTLNYKLSDFQMLSGIKTKLSLLQKVWQTSVNWDKTTRGWLSMPFLELAPEDIRGVVLQIDDLVGHCQLVLPDVPIVDSMRNKLHVWKDIMPIVFELRSDAFKPKTWDKVQDAMGAAFVVDESLTLNHLLKNRLLDFKSEIHEITKQANTEYNVEVALSKVAKNWEVFELQLKLHKDTYLLGATETVFRLLEDDAITLTGMQSLPQSTQLLGKISDWHSKLTKVIDILNLWATYQRHMVYLEGIFSSADIHRQLPRQTKLYVEAEKEWKEFMQQAYYRPLLLAIVLQNGVQEMMQRNIANLEAVIKALNNYLEMKRSNFPRFYFLSNDELLEIVSHCKDLNAIQPHLPKCFESINELVLSESSEGVLVSGMKSLENEVVPFVRSLKVRGNVESWLQGVEQRMKITIRDRLKTALNEYPLAIREDWIFKHPAQVILIVNQVTWCKEVAEKLGEQPHNKTLKAYHRQKLVGRVTTSANLMKQNITSLQRLFLESLLILEVHQRDLVADLIERDCDDISDYNWTRILRYYWVEDDIRIRHLDYSYEYGYEYLGCPSRIVVTPLTERCFLTCTQAMRYYMGGSLEGPAGTGKTETVKELARAFARQCIVFNCSDTVDYKMIGQLFSGLVQTGAWACFDEFNRLDLEVLSVAAYQLQTIQNAMAQNRADFVLEGSLLKLNMGCGFYITMNPTYAGRQELPGNLKSLFRPIAMAVPDQEVIAEVLLFCTGFNNAKVLGRKLVYLYRLCAQQLSGAKHYDYGLRSLKSILVMGSAHRLMNPTCSEEDAILYAVKASNIPRLLAEDKAVFFALVQSVFPSNHATTEGQERESLRAFAKHALEVNGKTPSSAIIESVLFLLDLMKSRTGVVVLGPTGAGKSMCIDALAKMISLLSDGNSHAVDPFTSVKISGTIFPKGMRLAELFGVADEKSGEWIDGLIGYTTRQAIRDTSGPHVWKWIVFDGPIEPVWVENLNSVLDDNKTLCLANGERMRLGNDVRMVFETEDLEMATPATVSRMGVLYVPLREETWSLLLSNWLKRSPLGNGHRKALQPHLEEFFKTHYVTCLHSAQRLDSTLNSMLLILSTCAIFESLLEVHGDWFTPVRVGLDESRLVLWRILLLSTVWGVGGCLDGNARSHFDSIVERTFEPITPLPDGTSAFAVKLNPGTLEFTRYSWNEVPLNPWFTQPLSQIYFSSPISESYVTMAQTLIRTGRNVLFVGESGSGKTLWIREAQRREIMGMEKASAHSATMTMCWIADADFLRNFIITALGKDSTAPTASAPSEEGDSNPPRFLILVDDLHTPQADFSGVRTALELLRQCMEVGGFRYGEDFLWKKTTNARFALTATMNRRSDFPNRRLLRHCIPFYIPPLEMDHIKQIHSHFLNVLLSRCPNNEDIAEHIDLIATASVDLMARMQKSFQATTSNPHYQFNFTDLARVLQGFLLVKPEEISSSSVLWLLWLHEIRRVFGDRMSCAEHTRQFANILYSVAAENRLAPLKALLAEDDYCYSIVNNTKMDNGPKSYEVIDVADLAVYYDDVRKHQRERYPEDMDLVLIDETVAQIARVGRILNQPSGHVLLIGFDGTGRKSVAKMSAHLFGFQLFEISASRSYSVHDFRDDIKKAFMNAGMQGMMTSLLLSDYQMKEPRFLYMVNCLLCQEEIPGMFNAEELDKITVHLKKELQSDAEFKKSDGEESNQLSGMELRRLISEKFYERVYRNLRIIYCASPFGEGFKLQLSRYPSLIKKTTPACISGWSVDALYSVAESVLSDLKIDSEELKSSIFDACANAHSHVSSVMVEDYLKETGRKIYCTPATYLQFLITLRHHYKLKRDQHERRIHQLAMGVQKMADANEAVIQSQRQIMEFQPTLQRMTEENEALLAVIARDRESANSVRSVVMLEEAEVAEHKRNTQLIADDAQRELDVVMPAMIQAEKALLALNIKDIIEIKSFQHPPESVVMVMESICVLKQLPVNWNTVRSMLNDPEGFREELLKLDKNNIPDRVMKEMQKYVTNPQFRVEKVEKVSLAAKSICQWAHSVVHYKLQYDRVQPKLQHVKQLELELQGIIAKMQEKQEALRVIEEQIEQLQRTYAEAEEQKAQLYQRTDDARVRLRRAEQLISSLHNEKTSWNNEIRQLNEDQPNLVGNSLLSAICMSYFGPFSTIFRRRLIHHSLDMCAKMKIPYNPKFDFVLMNVEQMQIRAWSIAGLPTDMFSQENAVMTTKALRWPLIIDPENQANPWIRRTEGESLSIVEFKDEQLGQILELRLRAGGAVLIENIPESLGSVLAEFLFIKGTRSINVGGNKVDIHPNFRLYMTSKNSRFSFAPDIWIKTNIIDFAVTRKALEDQLLGLTVKFARPELEKQKDNLVVTRGEFANQLRDIENRVLQLLNSTSGDFLDDENLIITLQQSEKTSNELKIKLDLAAQNEIEIDTARSIYVPLARKGSVLYFCLYGLGNLDPMYQYSLQFFNNIYYASLKELATTASVSETAVDCAAMDLVKGLYNSVSRGVYEKHRLPFAVSILCRLQCALGCFEDRLYSFFVQGPPLTDRYQTMPTESSIESWITPKIWSNINLLAEILPERGLVADVMANQTFYANFRQSFDIFSQSMTPFWAKIEKSEEKRDLMFAEPSFYRLVLLRCLRDGEAILDSIRIYVRLGLGSSFLQVPTVELESVFSLSTPATPILFLLTPSADPVASFYQLARQRRWEHRTVSCSLGQGQGPVANQLIETGISRGDWVLLQNCHLAPTWMSELERVIEKITDARTEIHKDFRLWLTCLSSPSIPSAVIRASIKVCSETPPGIQAAVRRAYQSLDESFLHDLPRRYRRMMFALSYFHALVQERRRFGPIGWSCAYEFGDSDFRTGCKLLRTHVESPSTMSYETYIKIIGDIVYGARIVEAMDQRLLNVILGNVLTHDLSDNGQHNFSADGKYFLPNNDDIPSLLKVVSDWPTEDDPLVLGLHQNASVAVATRQTKLFFSSLSSIERLNDPQQALESSQQKQLLDSLEAIVSHLPLPIQKKPIERTFISGLLPKEIAAYNKLLQVIVKSISGLQSALKGITQMSPADEVLQRDILLQKVPEIWMKNSFKSQAALGNYLSNLKKRIDYIHILVERDDQFVFNLACFFYPKGVFTHMIQLYSKSHNVAVDTIRLRCTAIRKLPQSAAPHGAYFTGLILEGASYDYNTNYFDEPRTGFVVEPMSTIWYVAIVIIYLLSIRAQEN